MHPTQADAIAGINTVYLTDYGIGKHSLESVNKKYIFDGGQELHSLGQYIRRNYFFYDIFSKTLNIIRIGGLNGFVVHF